jgi:hypothetical protein
MPKLMRFAWGPGLANILDCGDEAATPLVRVTPKETRPNKIARSLTSAAVVSWYWGNDCVLTFELKRISQADWEGATGWAMFVAWARRGHDFLVWPDYPNVPGTSYTCILVEPKSGPPDKSNDEGGKSLQLTIRTLDGTFIPDY